MPPSASQANDEAVCWSIAQRTKADLCWHEMGAGTRIQVGRRRVQRTVASLCAKIEFLDAVDWLCGDLDQHSAEILECYSSERLKPFLRLTTLLLSLMVQNIRAVQNQCC